MPFKKGEPRPQNAGRKPGSKNADTQWAIDLAASKNKHPYEVLLDFANRDYEALGLAEIEERKDKEGKTILNLTISPELQQKSAKDACEFILSKLKSIDHNGGGEDSLLMRLLGRASENSKSNADN